MHVFDKGTYILQSDLSLKSIFFAEYFAMHSELDDLDALEELATVKAK